MRPFPMLAGILSAIALVFYILTASTCEWLSQAEPNSQTYLGPFRACIKRQTLGIDESSYISNRCEADFSSTVGVIPVTDSCNSLRTVRAFLIIAIVFTAIAVLCYYLASFERVPVMIPRTHGILWSLIAGGSGAIAWAVFIHIGNTLGSPWVYSWGFGLATTAWVLNWLSSIFAIIRYPLYEDERKYPSRFDTGLSELRQTALHAGSREGAHTTYEHGVRTHGTPGTTTATAATAGTKGGMMESVKHALGFGKREPAHHVTYSKDHPEEASRERELERLQHAREEEQMPYRGEERTGRGATTSEALTGRTHPGTEYVGRGYTEAHEPRYGSGTSGITGSSTSTEGTTGLHPMSSGTSTFPASSTELPESTHKYTMHDPTRSGTTGVSGREYNP